MESLSIVKVDTRCYRKIAMDNWGLSSEQMKGMHVHHRIPVSKGGTNDPSNLYICSPFFHKHVWHDGEEWIDWAVSGGAKGGAVSGKKHAESGQLSRMAKKSHSDHLGTEEYSRRQLLKSIRTHVSKRRNWDSDTFEKVKQCYETLPQSGYRIAKKLGISSWKMVSNMVKFISLGFTFEELTDPELYVELYLSRVKV